LRVDKSEARYTARPVPKAVASVNSASVAASMQVNGHVLVVAKELKPFTHAALVLVGCDLSSIRFQGAKAVTIPTRSRSATDVRYCEEEAFRDPGGSMYCPFVQPGAFTRAYQVTSSFGGLPLGFDEYGDRVTG